jgi:hypothetical protein
VDEYECVVVTLKTNMCRSWRQQQLLTTTVNNKNKQQQQQTQCNNDKPRQLRQTITD